MIIQLGLLIYKLACGQELLHKMYTTRQVVTAIESGLLRPSFDGVIFDETSDERKRHAEAKPTLQLRRQRSSDSVQLRRRRFSVKSRSNSVERNQRRSQSPRDARQALPHRAVSQCAKLCMQSVLEVCLRQSNLETGQDRALVEVEQNLPLCCSATQWSPAILPHNVTCSTLYTQRKWLVWATAMPWLQLGSLDLLSGRVREHRLSLLPDTMPHLRFKHRYVESEERATAMVIAEDVGQLWLGVEKGLCGSIYVFDLMSFELLDSTDLGDQDTAVLSALALPKTDSSSHSQLIFVGLACDEVLVFRTCALDGRDDRLPTRMCICRVKSGLSQPCMAMARLGRTVLCSYGNHIATLDPAAYLKLDNTEPKIPRTAPIQRTKKTSSLAQIVSSDRGSCVERRHHRLAIMDLSPCSLGVWLVQRHSSLLVLFDSQLHQCKAILDCK